MPDIPLNIVGGAVFSRYGKISAENTYNMFVTDDALVPYLGYTGRHLQFGNEARGIFFSATFNVMIEVIDRDVYEIDSVLNYQKVGEIDSSNGIVYITENNAGQFAISDLSNIYIYTHGGSVVKSEATFLPGYIDFQDGYFICGDRNSSAWHLSKLNDGIHWPDIDPTSGLTYAANYETKPDTVQATVAFNRLLFVMGNNGTELWRDVGNVLFPYQRDNSVAIDYGVVSIATIAEGFGYLVWLAKNEYSSPTIMVSRGGSPEQISTDGINFLLDKLNHPEQSSAFIFQNSTHIFYQITFTADNLTLVYDFTTGLFFTLTDEHLNYHIAKRFCHFNNTNYFISYGNNGGTVTLYETGSQFTTYDGLGIPRYRICAPIRKPDSQQFKIKNLAITLEQGQTHILERVAVSMSKNGAQSFGNFVTKDLNPQGYGANKLQFWQMGAANDVTFKIGFWAGDPHPGVVKDNGDLNETFVIINAVVEID